MPLSKPIKSSQKIQQNSLIEQDFYLSSNKLYKVNISKFMQEHVLAYFDITRDNNCSFCTIALSIKKSEEYWPDV
ncbi:7489_t:CDS:2 [Dentiscutata heterogama]|uniref:7489_t:CDS:1 n=1 Tax=Dentiscutata heterogama TaxID=1316150 RepID=A0ACA9KC13_9GLOM|nr:7489_t:CDS:2 [Dentiscutata heterogama]